MILDSNLSTIVNFKGRRRSKLHTFREVYQNLIHYLSNNVILGEVSTIFKPSSL